MRHVLIAPWLSGGSPIRFYFLSTATTRGSRPRCVTDGGTDRWRSATHDTLRQSVAPSLFAVDETNRLTRVSEPLARQANTEPGSLSGLPLSSLLSVPRGDLDCHLKAVRQRLSEADVSTVRTQRCLLATTDGQREVTVEFTPHPDASHSDAPSTVDKLVGTIRANIVDLEQRQPEATAGPNRFRQLFKQLPDPVAEVRFVDSEPIVQSVNPVFEETFGYSADELVDEPLNEYIVPESADTDATQLDREAANGEWTAREIIREAADGQRLFLFRGIPFSHAGQQCGFGVYTDVTDRESQQRYHEVLNRLLRHNLRNDLNVILGLADQLTAALPDDSESTVAGEQLKQRVLDLVETTRRARELQSVIDRSETTSEPVALDTLAAETADQLAETYPDTQLTCVLDSPTVGLAGPPLREAVVELVENAVEHTTTNPTIEIRVENRPVNDSVVVTVADDGPGIPPDELAVIEGSQSISPLDHCSGLGLWLAKWVVEAYGGEIAFVGPDDRLGGAAVELRVRQATSEPADRPKERET